MVPSAASLRTPKHTASTSKCRAHADSLACFFCDRLETLACSGVVGFLNGPRSLHLRKAQGGFRRPTTGACALRVPGEPGAEGAVRASRAPEGAAPGPGA